MMNFMHHTMHVGLLDAHDDRMCWNASLLGLGGDSTREGGHWFNCCYFCQ